MQERCPGDSAIHVLTLSPRFPHGLTSLSVTTEDGGQSVAPPRWASSLLEPGLCPAKAPPAPGAGAGQPLPPPCACTGQCPESWGLNPRPWVPLSLPFLGGHTPPSLHSSPAKERNQISEAEVKPRVGKGEALEPETEANIGHSMPTAIPNSVHKQNCPAPSLH